MNIEQLEKGLKEGKKIRIIGYVKPQNNYRLSDEIVNVEIDTQLPSYDILKRKALSEVKRKPLTEVIKKGREVGASKEDSVKALEEIKTSLEKNDSSGGGRFSGEKYKSIAPYVNMNTETGDIYFTGKQLNEQKVSSSAYKQKNSRPKTLVKDYIRKNLPNQLKVWKVNVRDLYKVEFI